jgi:hypothetical protein
MANAQQLRYHSEVYWELCWLLPGEVYIYER